MSGPEQQVKRIRRKTAPSETAPATAGPPTSRNVPPNAKRRQAAAPETEPPRKKGTAQRTRARGDNDDADGDAGDGTPAAEHSVEAKSNDGAHAEHGGDGSREQADDGHDDDDADGATDAPEGSADKDVIIARLVHELAKVRAAAELAGTTKPHGEAAHPSAASPGNARALASPDAAHDAAGALASALACALNQDLSTHPLTAATTNLSAAFKLGKSARPVEKVQYLKNTHNFVRTQLALREVPDQKKAVILVSEFVLQTLAHSDLYAWAAEEVNGDWRIRSYATWQDIFDALRKQLITKELYLDLNESMHKITLRGNDINTFRAELSTYFLATDADAAEARILTLDMLARNLRREAITKLAKSLSVERIQDCKEVELLWMELEAMACNANAEGKVLSIHGKARAPSAPAAAAAVAAASSGGPRPGGNKGASAWRPLTEERIKHIVKSFMHGDRHRARFAHADPVVLEQRVRASEKDRRICFACGENCTAEIPPKCTKSFSMPTPSN